MTNRLLPGLLLLVLVGLPASAQETDAPTGLAPAQSSFSVEDLPAYVRSVERLTTDVSWTTTGDSRREFNTQRLDVHARWERPRNGGTAVLVGAEIRPRNGRLHFAGHKINKITIDRNGVIHIDRKGIDAKIYKISRKSNGDLVLDMPWYLLGDVTIKAKDAHGIDIRNWPPTLQDMVNIMTALTSDDGASTSTTRHEGNFTWHVQGASRRSPLPFGDGSLEAASTFDVRGAGRLEPDGTFRTLGNQNTATVVLQVGDSRYRRANGNVDVDVRSAQGRFSGRYAIAVPADKGFNMTVDGDVGYALDARTVNLRVPSGTRIRANDARLSGTGRLVGSYGPGESSVVLRDGTYRLGINGPVGISRLKVGALTVDDIRMDGALASEGRLEELSSDRLAFHGSAEGDAEVESRGIRGALAGEDEVDTNVSAGSRLRFDLADVDVETRLPGPDGQNPVHVTATAGSGHVGGSLGLSDTRVRTHDVKADLGEVDAAFDLEVEGLSLGGDEGFGLRRARGSASAEVEDGGNLTYDSLPDYAGLPGTPVVPNQGTRRHKVVSGDTLNAIARRYDVPVGELRAANGIPANSSLIRAGETLVVPGDPGQPAATSAPAAPEDGHWTTRVDPGTRIDAKLDDASVGPDGLRARGTIATQLRLTGSDVRAGSTKAKILGAARATLPPTAFTAEGGRVRIDAPTVQVPVRISLDPGSTVQVQVPGYETNIVFDRAGSYAEFVVNVVRGPDGQLEIDELRDCDLLLHSDGDLTAAGEIVGVTGSKTVRYTGRMAFVPGGIDFYGKIAVEVEGDDDTPALKIRW